MFNCQEVFLLGFLHYEDNLLYFIRLRSIDWSFTGDFPYKNANKLTEQLI